ncbi:hypothetical protein PCASD_12491 [Puccinia coronata f. sp. avenae]|nr:hypothetical protein PCASD_12491 [Puccinia coronata f. sp. avenae]
MPSRSSSLLLRQKQPSLSSMRSLQLSSDTPKPSAPVGQRTRKSPSKAKNRQSQLKYIISSPIAQKKQRAYNEPQEENVMII